MPFDPNVLGLPIGVWTHDALLAHLRQIVLEGFVQLAADDDLLLFLLRRTDATRHGAAAEWPSTMAGRIRKAVLGNQERLDVIYDYPRSLASFPVISLIMDQDSQDTGADRLGQGEEETRTHRRGTLGVGAAEIARMAAYTPFVRPWRGQVQVGCWWDPDESARVLYALTQWVLLQWHGYAQGSGIRELSIGTGGGFVVPQESQPTFRGLTFMANLRWDRVGLARRAPVPTTASIRTSPCTQG